MNDVVNSMDWCWLANDNVVRVQVGPSRQWQARLGPPCVLSKAAAEHASI